MEKNSIYDWHDLRKAPADLPPARCAYLVEVSYKDEWSPDIGMAWWDGEKFRDCYVFDACGYSGMPNLDHPEVSIIAWNRIERFEEAFR